VDGVAFLLAVTMFQGKFLRNESTLQCSVVLSSRLNRSAALRASQLENIE
jgi:hypothetical protein